MDNLDLYRTEDLTPAIPPAFLIQAMKGGLKRPPSLLGRFLGRLDVGFRRKLTSVLRHLL